MRELIKVTQLSLVLCLCVGACAIAAKAQCTPHQSHETTVSVINASSWPITISVDGILRATVLPAEVGSDLNVGPGQHFLLAGGSIDGETFSVSRKLVVPAGSICLWTVTNPSKNSQKPPRLFIDPLIRMAVISLAIPNGM